MILEIPLYSPCTREQQFAKNLFPRHYVKEMVIVPWSKISIASRLDRTCVVSQCEPKKLQLRLSNILD